MQEFINQIYLFLRDILLYLYISILNNPSGIISVDQAGFLQWLNRPIISNLITMTYREFFIYFGTLFFAIFFIVIFIKFIFKILALFRFR